MNLYFKNIDSNDLSSDFLNSSNKSIPIEDGDYLITPTAKIYKNGKVF